MHYIRFLKPPSLSNERKGLQVQAKITITTDLGESFLYFDLPILAILIDCMGKKSHVHPCNWKVGNRELDISFTLPLVTLQSEPVLKWPCQLLVRPKDAIYQLNILNDLFLPVMQDLTQSAGLVLPVWSETLSIEASLDQYRYTSGQHTLEGLQTTIRQVSQPKRVARHINTAGSDGLCIWEETGESIARHIWDAGLVLSAFLVSLGASKETLGLKFPKLLKALVRKEKLAVLELGTGCGIVGITMATSYPKAEVLITDLPEAEDIVKYNISPISRQPGCAEVCTNLTYQNLNWEDALPRNLRTGRLDLILVADCTYNSDVVPNLINTLSSLLKYNKEVLILVAMKIRHDSEMIFFELMSQNGMAAMEKILIPLPLLGEESEEIEIHLFTSS